MMACPTCACVILEVRANGVFCPKCGAERTEPNVVAAMKRWVAKEAEREKQIEAS